METKAEYYCYEQVLAITHNDTWKSYLSAQDNEKATDPEHFGETKPQNQ